MLNIDEIVGQIITLNSAASYQIEEKTKCAQNTAIDAYIAANSVLDKIEIIEQRLSKLEEANNKKAFDSLLF